MIILNLVNIYYDVKKRSKVQDLIHIRLSHKDHKQALVGAFSSKCEILQSPIDTLYSKESPVQD